MNLLSKNAKLNAFILVPVYFIVVYSLAFALFSWWNWRLVSDALFGAAIIAVNISWVSLTRSLKKERKVHTKQKDVIGLGFLFFCGYAFLLALIITFLI